MSLVYEDFILHSFIRTKETGESSKWVSGRGKGMEVTGAEPNVVRSKCKNFVIYETLSISEQTQHKSKHPWRTRGVRVNGPDDNHFINGGRETKNQGNETTLVL